MLKVKIETPWELHPENKIDLTVTIEQLDSLRDCVKSNPELNQKVQEIINYVSKRKTNEWEFIQEGRPFNERWHKNDIIIGKWLEGSCNLKTSNTTILYEDKSVGFFCQQRSGVQVTDEHCWEVYQFITDTGEYQKIGSCHNNRDGTFTVKNTNKKHLTRSSLEQAVLTCFMRSKYVEIERFQ